REDRAAREAGGVHAMVARSGDNLLEWIAPIVADQQASLSPGFVLVQAIECMACRDTRFATAAFVEVHFKSELLSCARQRQRNEIPIPRSSREFVSLVRARKPCDRSHTSLLGEQVLDQARFFRLATHGFL